MASRREYVVDISSRESSFDPPSYAIYHGKDYTLQWEPPVGSKDLAIALSYHFPLETSMERKMRAATKKFLKEEKKSQGKVDGHTTALAPVEEGPEEGAAFHTLASDVVPYRQSESSKDSEDVLPSAKTLFTLPEVHLSLARTKKVTEAVTTELLQDETVVNTSSNENTLASVMIQKKPEHEKPGNFGIYQTASGNGGPLASTKAHLGEATLSAPVEQPTDSRTGFGDAVPQPTSWVDGLELKEVKRKKRRYGMIEAAKVAANRGNACEEHRKRKIKCDPDSCPNNGLRSYQNIEQPRGSMLVQTKTSEIGQTAVSSVTGTKAAEGDLVTDFTPSIYTMLGTSEPHDRSVAPSLLENNLSNGPVFDFGLGPTPLQDPSWDAVPISKEVHQIDTDDIVGSAVIQDDGSENVSGPFDPLLCSYEFPGWVT
ncbi:hypothetical protein IFR05_017293, partial [Cadophora sp. M221]